MTIASFNRYAPQADAAADKYGIPRNIFRGLIDVETGGSWSPFLTSPAGAYGLAQLMPGTASQLGINRFDVGQNLDGGAKYLASLFQQFGNWTDALKAYNGGPGAVSNPSKYPTIQQSISAYASEVLGRAQGKFADAGGSPADGSSVAPPSPDATAQASPGTGSSDAPTLAQAIQTGNYSGWLWGLGKTLANLDPGSGKGLLGSLATMTGAAGPEAQAAETGSADPGEIASIMDLWKIFTLPFWQRAGINALMAIAALALVLFGLYTMLQSFDVGRKFTHGLKAGALEGLAA